MAATLLGHFYMQGTGVPKDDLSALMWFETAGINGAQQLDDFKDELSARMTSGAMDEARKRAEACLGSGYSDCD